MPGPSALLLTGGAATVTQTDEGIRVTAAADDRDPVDTIVWRDACRDNNSDHQLGAGFEWEGNFHNYLAFGEARLRGQRRRGLLMLAYPDQNVLSASWAVSFAKGQTWRIRYALTDAAVATSSNGLKFTLEAPDASGGRHAMINRVLKPGDRKVYDEQLRFDFPVTRITIHHDNLGKEVWDVLWMEPEGLVVPEIKSVAARPRPAPRSPAPTPRSPMERIIEDWELQDVQDSDYLAAVRKVRSELPVAAAAAIDKDIAALEQKALSKQHELWKASYVRACRERRQQRLAPYLDKMRKIAFARHDVFGTRDGTIYTEHMSYFNRHEGFGRKSALCLLDMTESIYGVRTSSSRNRGCDG